MQLSSSSNISSNLTSNPSQFLLIPSSTQLTSTNNPINNSSSPYDTNLTPSSDGNSISDSDSQAPRKRLTKLQTDRLESIYQSHNAELSTDEIAKLIHDPIFKDISYQRVFILYFFSFASSL